MINLTVALLLAIACLLIGLLFGYLFGNLGKGKEQKQISKPSEQPGMVEVVRFWSDAEGKKIIPEVDGKMIVSTKDLNPEQHQRLSRLLDQLSQSQRTPTSGFSRNPEAQRKQTDGTEAAAALPGIDSAGMPVQAPSPPNINFSLLGALGRSLQPEIGNMPFKAKSIAAQIDEILQNRLEGTPLAQKGIRLMELPGKGMVVMVGLEQFSGVSEVPDPEVQAIIREAVGEWENKVDISGV